jgi:glycerol-3-phosphate acyltransferase PlsY
MSPFVLLALAYGVGATPASFWLGKAVYGVDLRTKGSGNLGGTNTFRVLGWKAALPVTLVDIGKGWLPIWYFPQIQSGAAPSTWALAYGGAAVLGHVFSLWVGFKGGKGIATSFGVLLGLAPIAVAVCLVVWIGIVSVTRIVSVASLSAALTLPVVVYLLPDREGSAMVWFAVALCAFVVWAHRSNIRRLLRGEESSFRKAAPERNSDPNPEPGPGLGPEPGQDPSEAPT